MRWVVDREGGALRRIAVLLLALARLAERAGSMPLPVRVIVLAVLRRAEAVAFGFACDIASVAPARPSSRTPLQSVPLQAPLAAESGPAEAARLAFSLRALALIVAQWAIRVLSSAAIPSSAHRTVTSNRARPDANCRGPGALPAPDTS